MSRAAFPFKFRWWCHVESGPTVTGKTCQVILESHSFEKIKRIKNRTQFCPNGKASNGRPCSNSVWTKSPWARISSAVCPPANEQHRKPFLFSFFLCFSGSSPSCGALLAIWAEIGHLAALYWKLQRSDSTTTLWGWFLPGLKDLSWADLIRAAEFISTPSILWLHWFTIQSENNKKQKKKKRSGCTERRRPFLMNIFVRFTFTHFGQMCPHLTWQRRLHGIHHHSDMADVFLVLLPWQPRRHRTFYLQASTHALYSHGVDSFTHEK